MAGFSGAVKLANLDDFLAPSQACIKPLLQEKDNEKDKKNKGPSVKIDLDMSGVQESSSILPGHFKQIKMNATKKTATVSLNDCLACNGCVTSAEAVLITAQSTDQFLQGFASTNGSVTIVSISPQARAAIAHHFNLTLVETAARVITFLRSLGAAEVVDTAFSLDIALLETAEDFVARYQARGRKQLPVLTSECPGWVCYAEKTQGEYILPYISSAKSPQAVMGTFVKRYVAKKMGLPPDKVFHAAIMPCFDKKLEASRDDFYLQDADTREVDCVITSTEFIGILQDRKVDLRGLAPSKLGPFWKREPGDSDVLTRSVGAGGSGGYLEYVLRFAARRLFNYSLPSELQYKVGRNQDFKHVVLEIEGKPVLRFATAYGFRNIQNVVRQLKQGKCQLDFVEIMACPSGCLNGGGQLRAEGLLKQKQLLAEVDSLYHSPKAKDETPAIIQTLYKEWICGPPGSQQAKMLLHTQYHAVKQLEQNPLGIKW
eukprot:gb/GEZN01007387.1/.p1 GENE.gb/GEZN01007387.1/~~gb/GEZN01007387.1/.p1  ORF type:complete len:505 (-),score=73.67 gb/GEZN01007387.1/:30-1490(-)